MREKEKNTKVIPLSSQCLSDVHWQNNNQILLTDISTKYVTDKPFIEWCKLYISLSPNTLQIIIDTIGDIILDNNRIEVVDIPNMILLIVTNIQKEANRYDLVCSEHIISFAKLIMYTIIDYELFIISPILQNNLVVEAMINSCLELVKIDLNQSYSSISTTNKNEFDFFSWIVHFFCFWK